MPAKKPNREERIFVRLSKDEKAKFEKLAADRHTDISEIVRQLLHQEAEKVRA